MKQLPANFFVRTPTLELFKLVQAKLFELGCVWILETEAKEENSFYSTYKEDTYVRSENNKMTYGDFVNRNSFLDGSVEVSISDLFLFKPAPTVKQLEIKEIPWKIEVGEKVVIGCCTFEKEKLKQKLEEIWNLNSASRAKKFYFHCPAGENVIYLYEGRLGLDIWVNQKFEKTVSWNAVEKLMAEI